MRGHIRKRSKDSWTVVVELPRDPGTKKRRQKWVTVKGTRKDAERRLAELLVQADRGLFSQASGKMTLGEFLDYFLEIVKGKRENTYKGYARSFKAFRNLLGNDVKLANLETGAMQVAVNRLASRLKKSTVSEYFSKLNTAMRYAVKTGLIIRNPCEGVIVNKPDWGEKTVWDDDQANRFIRICKNTGKEYAALFILLLKTGARIGEVLALRWSDVDFEAGTIHITRTVSGSGYNPPKSKNSIRKVPLDAGTLKMLSKHKIQQNREKLLHGRAYNPENLVFCSSDGGKLSYQAVHKAFNCIVEKAGLPRITIHGLRHTHATFLLRHGHSVNLVAERLGDDPKTVMDTYAHVLPDMQKEVVKTIDKLYE